MITALQSRYIEVTNVIDISVRIDEFMNKLDEAFGQRVWFAGLQGSYCRGEATDESDIDMVVILDRLCPSDIAKYNNMLDTLPYRDLTCGFLSGKDELFNWEPSDLFQLCYDTKPIKGTFDNILRLVDKRAVDRAIKIGVCNIYHGCVHNMLYDKSEEILCSLYKNSTFTIRAICFNETGKYFKTREELLENISDCDKVILNTYLRLKQGETVDFSVMSNLLFAWAQNLLNIK